MCDSHFLTTLSNSHILIACYETKSTWNFLSWHFRNASGNHQSEVISLLHILAYPEMKILFLKLKFAIWQSLELWVQLAVDQAFQMDHISRQHYKQTHYNHSEDWLLKSITITTQSTGCAQLPFCYRQTISYSGIWYRRPEPIRISYYKGKRVGRGDGEGLESQSHI